MPMLLFSAPLKIIALKVQNGTLNITFNKPIKENNFKKYNIKAGIYYDINAELTLKRRTFKLSDGNITIAQNNKKISRIVVESKKLKSLTFKINKNVLSLGFKEAKKPSVKKEDSKAISNLFESVSPKSPSPKSTTKATKNSKDSKPPQKQVATQESSINRKNKIVVLDPGHGGKDCGAHVNKICEKNIVLKISNKARDLLKQRGYKVFVTRSSDKYISLRDRTQFANDRNANVFISIHANALDKKSKNYKIINGIETYFLSTARSERARKVAELENKDDIEIMNYFSKLSFLNSINSQRLLASNRLAIDVQSGMLSNARTIYKNTTDGGVREGPFWVLAGALMPSVLVEVGYMTNSSDLEKLQTKEYQDIVALGIVDGIDSYFLKNF